jgi:predicted PurR-regulated permease PerM
MAGFLFFNYNTGMQWSKWDPSTRVIAKVILAGLGLAFLWVTRDIIIILLLAVVLASAMEPLVGYLKIKRVPRAVTVLAVYILVLGIIALVFSLLLPVVVQQIQLLSQNLPQYTAEFETQYPALHNLIGNVDLTEIVSQVLGEITHNSSVYSQTLGVVTSLFSGITVLVVSFYLVAQQQGMLDFVNSVVPAPQRKFTLDLIRKIQARMGFWIIGQLFLSVCIFTLTFLGLTALGVKYALFLALLAGLLEIVPYIGPFLSAVPAVFFAMVQSPPLAIAVVALYIVVQKLEGYVLVPKIMQKATGTSPLLVLLALLVGFKLAGVLGLLLAIPLVSVITLLVDEFSNNYPSTKGPQPQELLP